MELIGIVLGGVNYPSIVGELGCFIGSPQYFFTERGSVGAFFFFAQLPQHLIFFIGERASVGDALS